MDPKGWRKKHPVRLFALWSALLLAAGPAAWAEAAAGVQIVGYSVSGSSVQVSLHNAGTAPVSGFLVVEALVDGSVVSSTAPFVLGAGETATVSVGFGGPVQEVLQLGSIIDTPEPF